MNRQKEKHTILQNHHILSLNSVQMKNKVETRFLGILLDKNLSFKSHYSYISTKLSKSLYVLQRASKLLPVKDLKTLYTALFLPYINYGLLAWGGICKRDSKYFLLDYGEINNPMRSLNNVYKLQKRALRIVSKSNYKAHHIPLCLHLKVLDLPDLYSVKALSFCYDHFHGNLPPSLSNILTFQYTRGDKLTIKTCYRRTDLAASTIIHTLPNIWNSLPQEVQSSIFKSKSQFLLKVKNYFLAQYESWSCNDIHCYSCNK